ncbi:hypothetical protein PG999_005296 [Apiospora kogelbergensis]|uniref:Uncharacterized protein n=1 Tax=Apiospora kogelbergensis TaxID=1337665 RepID=A0AAW0R1R9_9PEZI
MSISYVLPLMDGATGTVPPDTRTFHLATAENRRDALHARRFQDLCRLRNFTHPKKGADELEGVQGDTFVLGPLVTRAAVPTNSRPDLVNNEERTFVCRWNGADEEKEEGWEHYTWAVIGGMEWSEDHLRKKTLPKLTELFNHDIFLQRTLQVPTPTSTAVYNHVRANCVKLRSKQMNIIVHNTGALDMAWVMSRLCADLPPGQQMGKFNVYTFGSAMPEMTLPLGSHNGHEGHDCNCEDFPEYPIVNHYAFEDDPFAKVGVFMGSSSQRSRSSHSPRRPKLSWLSSGGRFTLDDYLDALFPEGNPRAGVLGEVMRVERDVSEMRELSALAKAVREVSRKGKRLSWTALGALAGNPSNCRNDRNEMAGVVSLEEARRVGKAMEGLLGYENNLLAAFVRGDYRLHLDEQKGFQAGCDECD